MRAAWWFAALLAASAQGWAQGALFNADVSDRSSAADPAQLVKEAEGRWLAFSLPALPGTRSPCCWTGHQVRTAGVVGCSLEGDHQSYGARSDAPLTDNILVFGEIRSGQVHDLRVFGEQCPVDGAGKRVTWLGDVDSAAAMDWLETAARGRNADMAMMALAYQRDEEAGQRLYEMAEDDSAEISEEAIFWLGHVRGLQGFSYLEKLLASLPEGENRRAINFALGQNDTPQAAELLLATARSDPDPEQRGEAMFWLAQEYPQRAEGWLRELVRDPGQGADLLEQAVFAVSQLPGESGDRILLEIATDEQAPRKARRQALFWLAHSDNESSVAKLTELLTR